MTVGAMGSFDAPRAPKGPRKGAATTTRRERLLPTSWRAITVGLLCLAVLANTASAQEPEITTFKKNSHQTTTSSVRSDDDGRWAVGETVEVALTFSEAVEVVTGGGVPSVGIGLGGTAARSAAYRSGSGTTELVFGYPLVEGDGSHSVMAVTPNSLALNGGTIRGSESQADAQLAHTGAVVQGTVERNEVPEARFEDVPKRHDGETAFEVGLRFSGTPTELLAKRDAASVLEVTGGSVTGAREVIGGTSPGWEVTVAPDGPGDVSIRLPARACDEAHAVCINGQPLSEVTEATVPGTPMTASFPQAPRTHDGTSAFELHMDFSYEPVGFSYRTVRDALFDIEGGRIEGVGRRERGSNLLWRVRVVPEHTGDVTLAVRETTDCGAQHAACGAGGRKLAGTARLTVRGPDSPPLPAVAIAAPATTPVTPALGAQAFAQQRDALDNWRLMEHAIKYDDAGAIARLIAEGADPNYNRTFHGVTPLHMAARRSQPDVIAALIEGGAAVDAPDDSGNTPLHYAVSSSHRKHNPILSGTPSTPQPAESIRILLGAGADANGPNNAGTTPLLAIGGRAPADVYATLLEAGVDPNAAGKNGHKPLSWALRHNHLAAVRLLLGAGADANAPDTNGRTPLRFANQLGREGDDMVTALLAAGADPNAPDPQGRTALHSVGWGPSATAMIEAGADPHIRAHDSGTPLHHAARTRRQSYGVIGALAQAGADLEARDNAGNTPLHVATHSANPPAILALIEGGSDVGAKNGDGQTPMHRVRDMRTALMLLDAGADPDAKDNEGRAPTDVARPGTPLHATLAGASSVRSALDGETALDTKDGDSNTPLHWAARLGDVDAIKALLDAGAELDARNGWGQTPLLMAAGAGAADAVITLVDAGADPNVFGRGNFEYSPLHAVAHTGNVDAVKALLDAGADPRAKDRRGKTALDWAKGRSRTEAAELLATVTND